MGKEKKLVHWTDIAANNIIREKGDKKKYVLAAGITPSGIVHIGNFREIITLQQQNVLNPVDSSFDFKSLLLARIRRHIFN